MSLLKRKHEDGDVAADVDDKAERDREAEERRRHNEERERRVATRIEALDDIANVVQRRKTSP